MYLFPFFNFSILFSYLFPHRVNTQSHHLPASTHPSAGRLPGGPPPTARLPRPPAAPGRPPPIPGRLSGQAACPWPRLTLAPHGHAALGRARSAPSRVWPCCPCLVAVVSGCGRAARTCCLFFPSWKIEDGEDGENLAELTERGLVELIVFDGDSTAVIWLDPASSMQNASWNFSFGRYTGAVQFWLSFFSKAENTSVERVDSQPPLKIWTVD
jgi:hypothetical protein